MVRVATLELLVADLIHLVRQIAPHEVDGLAGEAVIDRDAQMARSMPADAEDQRFRLHQVFESRARQLSQRRFSSRLSATRHAPTD
ncbi:MAG TPA: hypothetical protein VJP88_03675 [Caulobacteraceae bacterium]|nr:hypothetical protein [Caulobacteraceae bacterium]